MAGPKILLVDGNPGVLRTTYLILKMYGFNVTAVQTMPEAVREIDTNTFDLLLTDLSICHEGDGLSLIDAIKKVNPRTVTVVLTGSVDRDTLMNIGDLADGYVIKPVSVPHLLEMLNRLYEDKSTVLPE